MRQERELEEGPQAKTPRVARQDAAIASGINRSVLELQKTAGNQATATLLQDTTGSEIGAAVMPALQRAPVAAGEGLKFKPLEIETTKSDLEKFRLKQGEAENAIGKEIDRYVAAIQQGHRQGLANFGSWYRAWEKAKDDASSATAAKICKFILGKGLEIIFPEEEVFIQTLKKVAEYVFEKAVDHLAETPAGDIGAFLGNLQSTEESEITHLLDVHDKFMSEHADILEQATIEFIVQRDEGWPHTDKLPPSVLDMLRQAGIGLHGAAAATVFAERWLTAHIEGVYRQDWGVVHGAPSDASIGVMAQIAALREMQRTTGADNRERIFEIEKSLPSHFRMMVDINSEHYLMMHIRLGLDTDDAQKIAESRDKDGPFKDPKELVSRKLLSQEDYDKIRTVIVTH